MLFSNFTVSFTTIVSSLVSYACNSILFISSVYISYCLISWSRTFGALRHNMQTEKTNSDTAYDEVLRQIFWETKNN